MPAHSIAPDYPGGRGFLASRMPKPTGCNSWASRRMRSAGFLRREHPRTFPIPALTEPVFKPRSAKPTRGHSKRLAVCLCRPATDCRSRSVLRASSPRFKNLGHPVPSSWSLQPRTTSAIIFHVAVYFAGANFAKHFSNSEIASADSSTSAYCALTASRFPARRRNWR